MTTGKVVVLSNLTDPEPWEIFMDKKPVGWQVSLVNPNDSEQKIMKELEDAQYLATYNSGNVPSKFIDTAKQLKLIQAIGMDVGHLPMKWALEKGIPVCNLGGANAIAVAEHAVLLMLICLRRFTLINQSIREGKFRKNIDNWNKGQHQLYDKTIGIVGFGNIGRRVASLCYSFGTNIIYFERMFVPYSVRAESKACPVSLDELLSKSDIVSLHIPSFKSNRGLIGWEELCKMKPSAYIINTSRGVVIDEAALIRALNEKRIAGAGLDVWEPEPPDPKNPLLQMMNVAATPHVAGTVWENWGPRCESTWRNILLISEGKEPLNRILEF